MAFKFVEIILLLLQSLEFFNQVSFNLAERARMDAERYVILCIFY